MPDTKGKLLTQAETRARLRVSRSGFFRSVRPHLPAVKINDRVVLHHEDDVEAYIASRTVKAGPVNAE